MSASTFGCRPFLSADDMDTALLAAWEAAVRPGDEVWVLGALALGLDAGHTAHALAFSWLDNQVQAAVRTVPLGQSAGQRLLAALTPDIPAAVAQARNLQTRMDDWQSFAPMLAILSARHETQYSRLFRS